MLDTSLGTQVAKTMVAVESAMAVASVVKTSLVVVLVRKTIGLKIRACLDREEEEEDWLSSNTTSSTLSTSSVLGFRTKAIEEA